MKVKGKNKVGRPSNEIKYLRRIFLILLITIALSTVSILISFLVRYFNADKLVGTALNKLDLN